MPKIIVCGSFDFFPLYISIDGHREITISGSSDYPRSITIPAGNHSLFATTISKGQRRGGVTKAIEKINTTIDGDFFVGDSDVLLLRVRSEGLKTCIDHKLVDISEADKYLNMSAVIEYTEREEGQKNKWVVLLLCLALGWFGVHRFYEGKKGTGFLYLFTFGLCGIGVLWDLSKIFKRAA